MKGHLAGFLAVGFVFCGGVARGQMSAPVPTSPTGVSSPSATTLEQTHVPVTTQFPVRAVTGAPYSAVFETRKVQTLADGTHIDEIVSIEHSYRDSQGRVRIETYLVRDGDTSQLGEPISVVLSDPVANTRYQLVPRDHKAYLNAMRMSQPAASRTTSNANGAPDRGESTRPELKETPLGTDTIQGVETTGTRVNITYPLGSRGNDKPFTVVQETWTSNELRMTLKLKSDDPRAGEMDHNVTQLDRTEPDAALFQVPADYEIVDRQQ
jgi:hypothetical protein